MRAVLVLACVVACTSFVAATSIVNQRRHELSARDGPVPSAAAAAVASPNVWKAAGPTDCRSPCPALNTLANHGLIPRDGKNLDYDILKKALIDIYGLGPAFGTVFAHAATKKFADPNNNNKFSLCDLLINVHSKDQPSGSNGIEHSASLSRIDRTDFSHATDSTQRSPVAEQVDILLSSSSDGKMITVADFTKARRAYWAQTDKIPALNLDSQKTQQKIIADVEGCLLLGALSGNSNGGKFQISKAYAKSFLLNERLPATWAKSTRPLGIPELFLCLSAQGVEWAKNEFSAMTTLSKHWFGTWLW